MEAFIQNMLIGIRQWVNEKIDSLTQRITTAETKLDGIESGAQVNVIESVKVNGTALTPDAGKAVNVEIPAATVTGVKIGEKIIGIDGTELTSTISMNYDSTNKKLQIKGINNELVSEIDTTDFVKDGMLNYAGLHVRDNGTWVPTLPTGVTEPSATTDGTYIVLVWNTDAGKSDTFINATSLIDTYTAGTGLTLTNNQFSLNVAGTNNEIGGIKAGDNVAIAADGALSVPYASKSTYGVVRVADGIAVTNGVISIVAPYVTFTAQERGSTIGLDKLSTNQILEYSTDTVNWNTFTTAVTITLENVGDEVYIRGILNGNNTFSDYTQFSMTGLIAASGNCNALWNYEDLNAPLKPYCGYLMFGWCASLITAPELPSTVLSAGCYSYMFQWCTGLTAAPELPATELASRCYAYMFEKCTSLVAAPELPATTLARECYLYMFLNCINLNYIKCLAVDNSATDCTFNWVSGVSSTGTFIKNPSMTSWTTGNKGIPTGWTVVNHYDDVALENKLATKVESETIKTIWSGTQEEYDAITTKSDNILYIIK